LPPGLVQVVVGVPVAVRVMLTSPFPRPAKLPAAVIVVPLSVNVGPRLKCTFAATATKQIIIDSSNTLLTDCLNMS
jgi:hypothetical protein